MELVGQLAAITGRRHIDLQIREGNKTPPLSVASLNNRQDMLAAHFVNNGGSLEVAFVIHDGSSDSSESEVGAGLISHLAAVKLADLVSQYGIDSVRVGEEMYLFYLSTMRKVITLHPYGEYYLEQLEFNPDSFPVDEDYRLTSVYNWIKSHLLFCVVIGYFGLNGFRTLQRGDGGFYIDGQTVTKQYDDVPPYIGYHFYPRQKIAAGISTLQESGRKVQTPPPGFESAYYPQAINVAGFSDGMPVGKLPTIWDLLLSPYKWGEVRNKLEVRARQWWQEYVNPDLPSDGWLLSDDMSIAAFKYEGYMPVSWDKL